MMINLIKPEPKFRNGYKDKKRLSDIHEIPCVNCFAKKRQFGAVGAVGAVAAVAAVAGKHKYPNYDNLLF
jgi:hypothetical protein